MRAVDTSLPLLYNVVFYLGVTLCAIRHIVRVSVHDDVAGTGVELRAHLLVSWEAARTKLSRVLWTTYGAVYVTLQSRGD